MGLNLMERLSGRRGEGYRNAVDALVLMKNHGYLLHVRTDRREAVLRPLPQNSGHKALMVYGRSAASLIKKGLIELQEHSGPNWDIFKLKGPPDAEVRP